MAASGGGAYHSSHPPPMTQQKGYHSFDGGDINNSGMYTRPHPPGPYQQLTPGKNKLTLEDTLSIVYVIVHLYMYKVSHGICIHCTY